MDFCIDLDQDAGLAERHLCCDLYVAQPVKWRRSELHPSLKPSIRKKILERLSGV